MQSKNKKSSSKFKSFYLSCRNHIPCSNLSSTSTKVVVSPIPISKKVSLASHPKKRSPANYPSPISLDDGLLVETQWQRMHELEKELVELEEWLCTELARLKRHLKRKNIINNYYEPHCATKLDGSDQRNIKFGRLDGDEGYLYKLNGNKKVIHEACKGLVIQFSSPSLVPHDIGSTISEVLKQMAAMGKENLITWLLNSMPMTDISIKNTHKLTLLNQCNTPNDILEAILFDAIDKLGSLVIEGLLIQKGVKEVVKQQQGITRLKPENGVQRIDEKGKEDAVIIIAMLIQARDPSKGYEAVNEMMIGFVEAVKSEEDDEEIGFVVKGVHVAGLVARKRNGKAIHNCLWYVSA